MLLEARDQLPDPTTHSEEPRVASLRPLALPRPIPLCPPQRIFGRTKIKNIFFLSLWLINIPLLFLIPLKPFIFFFLRVPLKPSSQQTVILSYKLANTHIEPQEKVSHLQSLYGHTIQLPSPPRFAHYTDTIKCPYFLISQDNLEMLICL